MAKKRRVGGDRALAANDPGDAIARYADRLGERIGNEPERLQDSSSRNTPG